MKRTIWLRERLMQSTDCGTESKERLSPEFADSRKDRGSPQHLVWIFSAQIAERLDSATWLDTTEELRRRGWRVTLMAMGPAGVQNVRGIEVYCLPRRDIYLLGHLLFHLDVIRHLVRRWESVDLVLFNQDSAVYLLPLRYLRAMKRDAKPLLIMDTRDRRDHKPGSIKAALRLAYIRFNHWLAERLADGQTTITARYAELIEIPESQLWGIWPSGVNPANFVSAAEERKWPAEDDPIRLVYIGMLVLQRHPLEVCQAVKLANSQRRRFELYFYGGGPDADIVEECAASSDSVFVCSPIDHSDVAKMLARMHVGVTSLPDTTDVKYAASSPIKLFEYMASGLPIMATTNPCHTDVVGDGDYVFWIDEPTVESILDCLEQVYNDRKKLRDLGRRAQIASKQWTWGAAAAKLDEALEYGLSLTPETDR